MPLPTDLRPYMMDSAVVEYSADTALSDAAATFLSEVQTARPFKCPKCQGTGRHATSKDSGNPGDTGLVQCTQTECDGYGYTTVQLFPVITGYSAA